MKTNREIRVLIAEDDVLVAGIIRDELESIDLIVAGIAANGKLAVEMTLELKPDVVLMDITMPKMDGIAATTAIQVSCPTPVVILTAHDESELVAKATLAGVGAFVLKPPQAHELERAIAIAIARHADLMALGRMNRDLQQANDALHRSEELYRSILNASPDDITVTDRGGRIIMVSPVARTMFRQVGDEEFVGRLITDFLIPEDRDRAMAQVARKHQGVITGPSEYRGLRCDGTTFDIEVNSELIRDADGSPAGMVVIVRDITERKAGEKAVHESAAHYEALVHSINDAIISADSAGNIVSLNPAAERIFGYTEVEVRGQPITLLQPAQYHDRLRVGMARVQSGGVPHAIGQTVEVNGRCKDGSEFPILLSLSEWQVAEGKFFTAVIRDLTERKQAEVALRASEERYSLTLDALNDGLWDWNVPSGRAFFSPNYYSLLGYDDREFQACYASWRLLVHPEDLARVEEELRVSINNGSEFSIDLRMKLKSGQWRWVMTRGRVVEHDAEGKAQRMLGTLSDITARKQAEQSLQLNQRWLELAHRSANTGAWDWDMTNQRLQWSRELFALFGLDPDRTQATFEIWNQVLHRDDRETASAKIEQAIKERIPLSSEYRVVHPDGQVRWIHAVGNTTYDPAGKPVRMTGLCTDITERRASERTLRLHGVALEAAANAIVITDRQGMIEWANPAFSSLSGWSLKEAIGKNPRDLVKSGKHDAGFYQQMWEVLLAGKVWHGEIINRCKDGALRTEEMTITPLRGEQGEISHFIAIKQDITDHKMMQAHFLQAQRMEAIGTLAGGIAHDLNNILAPVLMVTSLVKDKLADEGDRELLEMTHASAQRGGEVIKQLLIFSRGQSGERKVLQPRHLIAEMGRLMRETFPREIKVQLQLPSVLWMICADPTQLHQVLMNLCVNARDAMPDGGQLTVEAANVTLVAGNPRVPPRAKPGPHVVITVSDTGHGIPPQIKHLIFDPFFSTKPVGKGTGLGLSTVLGIVHSHGGFVDVDSTPNEGSTFKVYFPAIPDEVEAVAEVLVAPAVQRTGDQTILVVDDERTAREMTRILLERQHYRVLTAVNGEDALMQYLGHRTEVTLVLTDLMMPVMSGVNLIRALRVINPVLKIVAMSGLTETGDEQNLAALGAPGLLIKPFDGPTLLEAVHRRLSALG